MFKSCRACQPMGGRLLDSVLGNPFCSRSSVVEHPTKLMGCRWCNSTRENPIWNERDRREPVGLRHEDALVREREKP